MEHRRRSDGLRMIYGLVLILILAGLALAIAIGHVEERTSYGLMPILMAIAGLSGQFAQWAFGTREINREIAPPPKPPDETEKTT